MFSTQTLTEVLKNILKVIIIFGVGVTYVISLVSSLSILARQDLHQALSNSMGLIDPTAVVEVFVSEAGTFTILASGTDGTSCILASGEGWDGATRIAGRDS